MAASCYIYSIKLQYIDDCYWEGMGVEWRRAAKKYEVGPESYKVFETNTFHIRSN